VRRLKEQSEIGTIVRYGTWFLHGTGAKPGYRTIVNAWFVLHSILSGVLTYFLPIDLSTAASAVLLPLAGVLVGLSIAWAGVAYAVLQSPEIARLAEYNPGGLDDYVFKFETSILALLFALVLWGLAGIQIFDKVTPTDKHFWSYLTVKWVLFTTSSIALRECWQVVHYSHVFLRLQAAIKNLPAPDRGADTVVRRVNLR
jgi:hypothetical protein